MTPEQLQNLQQELVRSQLAAFKARNELDAANAKIESLSKTLMGIAIGQKMATPEATE